MFETNQTKIKEQKAIDSDSVTFLMAEYERLRDVRNELSNYSSRRFEFYLSITTAFIGAYLVILQIQNSVNILRILVDAVFFGLFVYGVITFINSTYNATFHFQILIAVRDIQKFFINQKPSLVDYLYFSKPSSPPAHFKVIWLMDRIFRGGSEKSL